MADTNQAAGGSHPLAAEWATFRRALPSLIEAGEADRYALISGDQLIGIWDSFDEAEEVGYDRFGLDTPFIAQRIDPRFLQFPVSPPPTLRFNRLDQSAAS